MSDKEIAHRYKQARTEFEKHEIIRILCELNACKKHEVTKIIEDAGLELPELDSKAEYAKKMIKVLHGEGMSDKKIAEELEMSVYAVARIRREQGIPALKRK